MSKSFEEIYELNPENWLKGNSNDETFEELFNNFLEDLELSIKFAQKSLELKESKNKIILLIYEHNEIELN